MKYGLIGEHLGHSYSKEIHAAIADYSYELLELAPNEVEGYLSARDFEAINVTIPYKEKVMPRLDHIEESAIAIGSVNTIVKRDGELYGYNTDFSGMRAMLLRHGIELENKKVLILGTGGTCKTALAVSRAMGAREILVVSRKELGCRISYETAMREHGDAEIIINTTPVGMYPNTEGRPIDISHFPGLLGVVDAIYHPLRTKLVLDAMARGIPACGGLYMLAAQAVYASALFLGKDVDPLLIDKAHDSVASGMENLVLIGMPSSGKSTVGRRVAEMLGREFVDSDDVLVKHLGMPIADFFAREGEDAFRKAESEIIASLSKKSSLVIATGGGVVLKEENVARLRQNSRLIFLDRSPEKLVATSDRPLSRDRDALMALYEKRIGLYRAAADITVNGDGDVESVACAVLEKWSIA